MTQASQPLRPRAAAQAGAFLFLQGPITPFFTLIANRLETLGHDIHCVTLSFGDQLFWRRAGTTPYRGRLADWPAFITDFMERHGITDLVLLGEQRDYHKEAIQIARERGIHVTVTDFGYLRPDWITLERDGMSGCSHFPRDPERIRELAARVAEPDLARKYRDNFPRMAIWDIVYHIANIVFFWRYPHYRTHKMQPLPLIYLGTGWRMLKNKLLGKRRQREVDALVRQHPTFFVYPLQLAYDFSLRAYSDYADQGDAIEEIIASFSRHAPADARLLVKVHPLDTGLRNWARLVRRIATDHQITDRVHYLDGGNLDQLCETARGMVTINSTSALRASELGCPTRILGRAVYDVPGMSFQGPLDAFWNDCQAPDGDLVKAFIKLLAATIQIRGVYYNQPGLDAAVAAATERLHENTINSAPGLDGETVTLLPEPGGEDAACA